MAILLSDWPGGSATAWSIVTFDRALLSRPTELTFGSTNFACRSGTAEIVPALLSAGSWI